MWSNLLKFLTGMNFYSASKFKTDLILKIKRDCNEMEINAYNFCGDNEESYQYNKLVVNIAYEINKLIYQIETIKPEADETAAMYKNRIKSLISSYEKEKTFSFRHEACQRCLRVLNEMDN